MFSVAKIADKCFESKSSCGVADEDVWRDIRDSRLGVRLLSQDSRVRIWFVFWDLAWFPFVFMEMRGINDLLRAFV